MSNELSDSPRRTLVHSFDHKKWLANTLETASVAIVAHDLYGKTHAIVSFVDRMITGARKTRKSSQSHHWTVSVLLSVARLAAWFVILYRNTRFGDAVDVVMQLLKLVIAALRGPPNDDSVESLLLGDRK